MTKCRVAVLGHRGMLGHVAVRWFHRQGFDVSTTEARFDPAAPMSFLEAVRRMEAAVVVNAIGLIKQKSADPGQLLTANAQLPMLLRLVLPRDVTLIHASTDCVFSGRDGWYPVDALRDALDAYGVSKALGEMVGAYPNTVVIRTSIIGPERHIPATGLLGWFLSHPAGAVLTGYTDHWWNGITTLEWCRVAEQLVEDRGAPQLRIVQPGTERRWTKAEMLRLFAKEFARAVTIVDSPSGTALDRTLQPTLASPPLDVQLRDLVAWMAREPAPA